MNNEFVNRLKKIENELLALKTATEYTSLRSMNALTTDFLTTGFYQINYEKADEDIIAFCYPGLPETRCWVYVRTPGTNSQVVEVNTTYWDNETQQYITESCPISIISNAKVIGITRI